MFRSFKPSPAWRPWALFMVCAGVVLLLSALTACGGGVGEDGTGAPVKATSVGVVTGISADSVTVSEQTYALPASVQVSDAMVGPLSVADIQPGMWVEVQGETDAQGGSAVALRIQLIPSVRGAITQVGNGQATLTVLDTTISLDANTLLSGANAQALQVGDTVEVHGLLDNSQGQITATRVAVVASVGAGAELRGQVTSLDTVQHTMRVGGRLVSYGQATLALPRGLSEGMVVRVSSAVAPTSGQIWVLDRVLPGQDLDTTVNAAFVYLEGHVDDWATGPTFRIDGLPVLAAQANGKASVTQDGLRVAVIGSLRNGAVLAK